MDEKSSRRPSVEDTIMLQEEHFCCPVCTHALMEPIFQCEQGHIICKPCLDTLRKPVVCPSCSCALNDPIRNRAMEGMLELFPLACRLNFFFYIFFLFFVVCSVPFRTKRKSASSMGTNGVLFLFVTSCIVFVFMFSFVFQTRLRFLWCSKRQKGACRQGVPEAPSRLLQERRMPLDGRNQGAQATCYRRSQSYL